MKKLIVTGSLAGMLTLMLSASPLEAQGQGGDGPRGGGGGPGGPGGRRGRVGAALDPARLLGMKEVRDELEITDEQAEQIRELADELRPAAGERRERPDFQNMSDAERAEFRETMQAQLRERAQKMKGKLSEILLPPQLDRLQQISIQVQGIGALRNEEFAKKLGVSDEQKTAITEAMESAGREMREKMRELFQSGDMEQVREKMSEMRKEIETKALSHLTDEQRKMFEEAKGEPFEMPAFDGRGAFGRRAAGDRRRPRGDRPDRPRPPATDEPLD